LARYVDVGLSLRITWVSMLDVLTGLRIGYKVAVRRALFSEVARSLRVSVPSLVAVVSFSSIVEDGRAVNFALRHHVFLNYFLLMDIFSLGLIKGANGSFINVKDSRAVSNHTQAFRCFGCAFDKPKYCALLLQLPRAENGGGRLA
jgi:hypothetical protein